MKSNHPDNSRQIASALVAGIAAGLLIGISWATAADGPVRVTQKGRAFKPAEIAIKAGDTVQFVNDDGDLLHHAYSKSEKFSFDSGDQQPGSTINVVFPVAGTFTVMCGIHPKMKLVVKVE